MNIEEKVKQICKEREHNCHKCEFYAFKDLQWDCLFELDIAKTGEKEEKTADEMFEELGYKKYDKNNYLYYEQSDIPYKRISFNTFLEEGHVVYVSEFGYDAGLIKMEELQAINQKCRELNWLE